MTSQASEPAVLEQVGGVEHIVLNAENGGPVKTSNGHETNSAVVFVDPSGTRWTFPFEQSKTWMDVRDLVKLVYVDCFLPDRYADLLDEDKVDEQSFRIINLKPEKTHVLPQHWENLVSPGWEFEIEFYGGVDVLDKIRATKAEAKDADNDSTTETDEPETSSSKIVYLAKYLLPDNDGDLRWNSDEKFQDKPTVSLIPKPASSVLEEHREFICNDGDESLPLRDRVNHYGVPVLYVLSPTLLNALKAVISFQSPPESFTPKEWNGKAIESSLDNGRFVYPFTDLFNYKERLREYRDEVKAAHDSEYSETCREHLDILLGYLEDQSAMALKDVALTMSHATPTIAFSALWFLLKPGSDVYVREDGAFNAYVVESIRNKGAFSWSLPEAFPTAYSVIVWNLSFDGRHLTRSVKEVTISVFDGQREIKSLPVFPIRFHDDDFLRQNLVDRGMRFVEMMRKPAFREYSGPSKLQGIREFNRTRVVIDHTSEPWTLESVESHASEVYYPVESFRDIELGEYIRMPKCPCQSCESKEHQNGVQRRMFDDYDDIDLQTKPELTDHQYILCASHVYGFVLKDRVWDVLDVQRLEHPRIQSNIIDMLVMKPENNKQMIKAICEIYGGSFTQTFSSDFIDGKGEGQILLLHGPPGTGKTLTAESVAEYTARPLLSITAADLGHEPEPLEQNLLRFFRDAKKWNAIVLLDEADVYLETRAAHDLQRNSIVSIFLRALDYFQGILFLTTNRVGRFDEAFMSRIHVQIGYDPLDEGSRQQIWDNHFNKISRNHETHGNEIRVSYGAKEFVRKSEELSALKWNGREIRNAFQTALALACFHAKHEGNRIPELTDGNIRQVVKMSQNFKDYLHSVRGAEGDMAFHQRVRNDETRASGTL